MSTTAKKKTYKKVENKFLEKRSVEGVEYNVCAGLNEGDAEVYFPVSASKVDSKTKAVSVEDWFLKAKI